MVRGESSPERDAALWGYANHFLSVGAGEVHVSNFWIQINNSPKKKADIVTPFSLIQSKTRGWKQRPSSVPIKANGKIFADAIGNWIRPQRKIHFPARWQ